MLVFLFYFLWFISLVVKFTQINMKKAGIRNSNLNFYINYTMFLSTELNSQEQSIII